MALSQVIDDNRNLVLSVPAQVALVETYDATVSASTSVALNAAAKIIEVTAIDKPIFYKWGGVVSSADFDGIVAQNTSKILAIPLGQTTIQFIEEAITAKLAVVQF